MRHGLQLAAAIGVVGSLGASAAADVPKMGGEMNHVLVTLYQKTVYVTVERPDEMPLGLRNYHEWYDGAACVLDRTGYNAQFGWLANGFISLPPDAAMWIESVAQTPGLRSYEQGTFAPIFGTAGSPARWAWDGTMTHNWYAAMALGDYDATYSVYVGTLDGEPYSGYTPGGVTLRWTYETGGLDTIGAWRGADVRGVEPATAPGTAAAAAAGLVMLGRRRR